MNIVDIKTYISYSSDSVDPNNDPIIHTYRDLLCGKLYIAHMCIDIFSNQTATIT